SRHSNPREAPAGRRGVHVPARQRPALSGAGRAGPAAPRSRFRRRFLQALRRGYRGFARGRGEDLTTLAAVRGAPGLTAYLDALEERLARTVASHPGLVAAVGNEALAAGGKRLRPALVFLSAPPGEEPPPAAGGAAQPLPPATLVPHHPTHRPHPPRRQAA